MIVTVEDDEIVSVDVWILLPVRVEIDEDVVVNLVVVTGLVGSPVERVMVWTILDTAPYDVLIVSLWWKLNLVHLNL